MRGKSTIALMRIYQLSMHVKSMSNFLLFFIWHSLRHTCARSARSKQCECSGARVLAVMRNGGVRLG